MYWTSSISQSRIKLWDILIREYSVDKFLSYKLLLQYVDDSQYYTGVLLKFDLPYFKRLITSQMQPEDFGSCYLVNFYAIIAGEKRVSDEELKKIASDFETQLWKLFLLCANDPFLRGRERGDYHDYEKRETARANRIRQSVGQYTAVWYKEMHQEMERMMDFEHSSRYNFALANDLLLSEIAKKNPGEALKALRYYSKKGNWFGAFPGQILQVFFEAGREWGEKVWTLIDKSTFSNKFKWMDYYFTLLPSTFIDKRKVNRLLKNFQDALSGEWLFEKSLDKYEAVEPRIYQKVLHTLFNKRKVEEKFVFHLGHHFFQTVANKKVSLQLCKAVYFQQDQMPGHFDNDSAEFFSLFDLDRGFLMEYSRYVTTACPMRFLSDYRPLGKIWDYPDAEELVGAIFEDLLILSERHFSREMAVSLFFGVKSENNRRAVSFLERVIRLYKDNDQLIDWIFEIARNYLKAHYMELIVAYLRQNPDLERFKKKNLLSNSFFTSTNEIWEEVRAGELQKIHSKLVDELDWIIYKEHLNFINQWIRSEKAQASLTRKKRFRKQEF